jgi:hypothetical protein
MLEATYSAGEDPADVALRASDLLDLAGHEREACEMRCRVMAALEANRGREAVLGIIGQYVELLPIQ